MDLNYSNFQKTINTTDIVIVKFYVSNCEPCLKKENIKKMFYVNSIENEQLTKMYNIVIQPTYLVFKNGELIDTLFGFKSKNAFSKYL